MIKCVDLSKWILDKCNPDDEILMKMDIEGAEFAVLEKMIADNTIGRIKRLWVEFHVNILPESYKKRELASRAACPIPIEAWE